MQSSGKHGEILDVVDRREMHGKPNGITVYMDAELAKNNIFFHSTEASLCMPIRALVAEIFVALQIHISKKFIFVMEVISVDCANSRI